MTLLFILYLLNTMLLIIPLWIQFRGITKSPENDREITSKVWFFVFDLLLMAIMWLCYLGVRGAAWFFLFVAIVINVWAYKRK